MALADVRLSLLVFPQLWAAGVLEARVLLLPAGDPTQTPGAGLPAFAGTDWALRAMVLPGLDSLLGPNPGGVAGAQSMTFTATAPDGAAALLQALAANFNVTAPAPIPTRQARLSGAHIRKQLPTSYTQAFTFERPGPGTTTGDEFACALRDTVPALGNDPKPPSTTTWGAVLSFALRQPLLARALGLIHDLSIPVASPTLLSAGGWLYVELDPAGPVQPLISDAVRSYAAHLPALNEKAARRLFAAVLFPVGLTAAGDYGQALAEAAIYDDGFAKVAHAAQAITADAASSGHNELKPATDAGIDLGWDDEQVTAWLNRQLDGLRARLGSLPKVMEAPLGVSGYRVDVRMPDDPQFNQWESLCRAFSANDAGAPAPLQFPSPPANAIFSADFNDELTVEPTPTRSIHATDGVAWLPRHFTRWQDGSLVVNDTTLFQLAGTSPLDANKNPLAVPAPTYGAVQPGVRLRYGNRYEFRCRFADLTGGGPIVSDDATNPAPHPIAAARFLRHVPPKSARLATDVPKPEPGEPTPPVPTVSTINAWRPLIGYPEMVFARIDDPAVIAKVIQNAPAARNAGDALGANDPDVTHLRVSVQVRAPAHDPGPNGLRDGEFRELYVTELAFPPFDPLDVLTPGAPLPITLQYVDQADVAVLAAPAAGVTVLPIPRGRDVRLRLTPVCADKPDYFGADWVRDGLTADVATRAAAESEVALFAAQAPEVTLNGIMLQPAPDMVQRLAAHLGLAANGLTLGARPGERVVFGASGALRHTLSGDRGAIAFAGDGELLGHWLAAIQIEIDRDWTWDGLDDEGIVVSRRELPAEPLRVIGQLQVPFSVPAIAVTGDDPPGTDRRARTRLVFFDAVDPKPTADAFPTTLTPEWVLEPRLRALPPAAGQALAQSLPILLPVAVAPRQTPKLVSAGVALSPYKRDDAYSSTDPRRRVLWFEFDQPVADPNDVLFARVLAYGPDPLLSGLITHLLVPAPDVPVGPTTWFDIIESLLPNPHDPPPLAIDPEPMRVIVPNQPEDSSGLDAMKEMPEAIPLPGQVRATHFMVPLPPGFDPDAPELFGFWTYELRVGHKLIWSTAQARFGRPLVVKGVQHPPPALRCAALRVRPAPNKPPFPPRIVVTAPHATAVFNDKRLTQPTAGDPRTRIWVLLYAQVTQADGASRRNVLLARAPAVPQVDHDNSGKPVPPKTRDVMSIAQFDEQAVAQRLADLALPANSPLSVITVELLPGDRLVQQNVSFADQQIFFTFDQPDLPLGALDAPAFGAFIANVGTPSDPLGAELGSLASRRILRCSPLTPVTPVC